MSALKEYADYYNRRRPHQGLGQRIPMMPVLPSNDKGPVCCRNVLGGVKPKPVGEPVVVDENITRQRLAYDESVELKGFGNFKLDFFFY